MASYAMQGFDGRVEKNIRFAAARALTQTAKAASETVASTLPTIFDRPTPFTQRSIGFTPAKRDDLAATVFVRSIQAGYLQMQETGGIRTPKPGSPINLAVKQRLNQYGNITRGAIARQIAKDDTFVSRGKGKTKHLPPGIYQRAEAGSGRRKGGGYGGKGAVRNAAGKVVGGRAAKGGTTLQMLVAFRQRAAYAPRFRFEERTKRAALAVLRANMQRSLASALASIR